MTAAVFRVAGKPAFALLAIIQSTVGILEYAAIGLSPAIISLTAEAIRDARNGSGSESISSALTVYANGFFMALLTAIGGAVFLAGFIRFFNSSQMNIHSGGVASELVLMVGIATLLRLLSDAPPRRCKLPGKYSSTISSSPATRLFGGSAPRSMYSCFISPGNGQPGLPSWPDHSSCCWRAIMSHRHGSGLFDQWWRRFNAPMVRRLLIFGGTVVAAQMADYLYAPTDNLLILNLIDQATVAVYTPAVQIDGGALLLAGALASVLLPRTAIAHASGNPQLVRKYYIRGTLATFILLLAAAPLLWLAAPFFFRLWLGNRMDATCAILPLMLIHTVIGGSSAVGRAILLAIGKVRPFALSVLIAGIANVALSFTFVRFCHLGLRGIVLGTIVAVTARFALWMPWYTLRVLKRESTYAEPLIAEFSLLCASNSRLFQKEFHSAVVGIIREVCPSNRKI